MLFRLQSPIIIQYGGDNLGLRWEDLRQQKSYLKDTIHFINFIEKTKVSHNNHFGFYGYNQLVHKYPTRGGHKNSM